MLLAVEAYRISDQFPRNELFGLTQQLRRASVSVPSNIAEGTAVVRVRRTSIISTSLWGHWQSSRRS